MEALKAEVEAEENDLALSSSKSPAELASGGCFLSEYWKQPENDDAHLIIHRNEHGMILLNRYPYSNGHLLIALGEGRPRLLDYEPEQRAEFWNLIEFGSDLLERTLSPQGKNIGINEGRAGGAGVPQHLHAHIVPRWNGDTNFITVVGEVRVIPASLEAMFQLFKSVMPTDSKS